MTDKALNKDEVNILEQKVQTQPYISAYRAILTNNYLKSGSTKAEDQVKQTALRVFSRSLLHTYLFDGVESIPEIREDSQEKNIERNESNQAVPELNEQLVAAALGTGYTIDLIEESQQTPTSSKAESNTKSTTSKAEVKNVEFEQQIPAEEKETIDNTQITEEQPTEMSFTSWMSVLSDQPLYEAARDEKQTTPSKISKEVSTSIVDHFLENEDSIVPKRAEFYSPSKAAKASLEDKENLVTETLARIYENQGNIEKAISTYGKLSLCNPEKSAYFAALIQKLNAEK